jgi:micrococcal nuclease
VRRITARILCRHGKWIIELESWLPMDSNVVELSLMLLIALVIVAAIARRPGQRRRDEPRPLDLPPVGQPRPIRPVFDAASARPVLDRTVLQGSAYVIDGDTVVICKTQIRLYGIDAPEMDHPYGKNAKWTLVALCKGQIIRAEIRELDAHGRTVAQCFLPDGRDLSAEMVKAGMAIDWPKFSSGRYAALEVPGIRRKLWLADARQKGRMHVWEQYEAKKRADQLK